MPAAQRLRFAVTMSNLPSIRRPHHRSAIAAAVMLTIILAAAAYADPSGLLAPVSGRGLPLMGTGGVYRWAPLLIGLPVLIAVTILPIAYAARTARSARWIFVVAWASSVGASVLATTATGFAASIPLVGRHLPVSLALRFAASTAGFAGIKFLLVGVLVATVAAIAFRIGPRPAQTESIPPSSAPAVVIMFVVVTLTAIGFGARWWRGGPVGYAFQGLLIAPTAAAGIVGFLAGVAVFLAVFTVVVRAALRRIGDTAVAAAVATWFAAIVAGIALAVLDAIAAALPGQAPPADAGPDSWSIATTLISLGTAIGYGAAVGLIAAIVTGLAAMRARGFDDPSKSRAAVLADDPRHLRVVGALMGVLLLALPLVLGGAAPDGPSRTTPTAAAGGLERLRLLPAADGRDLPTIGDVTGRQVLLRGVDVNQLIDYYLRDPNVPANEPLTDADFAQMAAMGFDVVRLGMSWSRLEPQRGVFDQAYLQQIGTAVAQAKAHGIYTVLDMHEDAWGNALASPDQQCGGGTSPTTGYDGAPAWATITDGTLHCQFMARDLAPAVGAAFGNFYTDRDGIQTELVRTWAFVAKAFAGEPAVAGYDLLNEPGIGANPPISSGLLLGRYYSAAIDALRGAERSGGGFSHLIFFEPSVLWSGLGFDVTPPPGFTSDRELVFAPHPYSESITMDQSLGLTIASIERNLTMSSRAAASYGAALWAGEWGWFGDPAVDGAKVARFTAEQDRLGIGGAFWVWRQGCGSPETGADAVTSGNFVGVTCATGAAIAPPAGFAQPLSRAYPKTFPGRLDTLSSNGSDLRFAATTTAGAECNLDVWIPGDATPQLTSQGVADSAVAKVAGGWEFTGCASGRYSVTIG
jgi:hypothetical protein